MGFFGTVLAFIWFYKGIDKIGPSQAAVLIIWFRCLQL